MQIKNYEKQQIKYLDFDCWDLQGVGESTRSSRPQEEAVLGWHIVFTLTKNNNKRECLVFMGKQF